MPIDFDPIEYARFAERLTVSFKSMGDALESLQETHRDFSDEVIRKITMYEMQWAQNSETRMQVRDIERAFNDYRSKNDSRLSSMESSFKAWLSIGIGMAATVGGAVGNYISQHIK